MGVNPEGLFELTEAQRQITRCSDPNTAEAQRGLTNLIEDMDRARRYVHLGVEAMRAAGHTWAQIGEVMGITRQAAQERFKAKP